jgi:hypothetical protein
MAPRPTRPAALFRLAGKSPRRCPVTLSRDVVPCRCPVSLSRVDVPPC